MFKEELTNFLHYLVAEKGASQKTILSYESDLKHFFTFFTEKDALIPTLTTYVQHLSEKEFENTTISRKLSTLRHFFKFLRINGAIDYDPLKDFQNPKKSKALPKILEVEQVETLLTVIKKDASLEGKRFYAIIELAYATGLRVSELVELPLSSLRLLKGKIIQPQLLIKGKGGKERIVFLSQLAIEAIEVYLPLRGAFMDAIQSQKKWLFCSSLSQEGHLTRQYVGKNLKKYALEAGVDPDQVSPHVLRHAFATHLLRNGANLMVVQKLLGHSDISTTQLYTHLANQQVFDLVFKHHPLAKT